MSAEGQRGRGAVECRLKEREEREEREESEGNSFPLPPVWCWDREGLPLLPLVWSWSWGELPLCGCGVGIGKGCLPCRQVGLWEGKIYLTVPTNVGYAYHTLSSVEI